jgi:hypothetical protein
MAMTFGFPSSVCVLFSSWDVHSAGSWAGVIFAIFGTALLREFIIVYRQERSFRRRLNKKRQALSGNSSTSALSALFHQFIDSLSYTISLGLAYLLMLVVMTYHGGLFISVVCLTGLANFICSYGLILYRRRYTKLEQSSEFSHGLLESSQTSAVNYVSPPAIRTAVDPCCADLDIDD